MRACAILLVAVILTPSGVAADDATPAPPDSDGPSRGALFFNLEKQKLQELGAAALGSALAPNFAFPKNTRDTALFGVDVSHWDEDNCSCTFNWTALADKKVVFAYVKASHGDNKDPDPRFNKSWQALAKEPRIIRGAYHFFSSSSDPLTQAKSFVDKVNKAGGQLQTDLPPAMDLEWDVRTENDETIIDPATGKAKDFWKGQSPDTIIKKVLTWLEYVKKETGRTPIIYTNYQWWLDNIKDSKKIEQLKDYIVWIADYSVEHTKPENPELPNDWNWKLWQFTAKGDVTSAGIKFKPSASGETIDVSMFKGTMEDFLLVFDVAPRSAAAKKDDQKLAVLTNPAKKDDKATDQPPQPKPTEEAKKDDKATDQPPQPKPTEEAKKDDKATSQPPQPKPAEEAKKDDKATDQPPQPKPAEEAKKDDKATGQPPQPKPTEEAKKDDKATDKPPQPKPAEAAKKDDKATDQPPQPKPAEAAKKDDKATDQPPQPKPAEATKKDDKTADKPEVARLDEPKKADAQVETQQTVVGPKPDVKSTTAPSPAAADKRSIAEIVLKNGRIIRVDINIDPVLLARIVATVDKP